MYKRIDEVVPGETFTYNGRTTQVTKVDLTSCMHKVHINTGDCYENFTMVITKNEDVNA